MAADRLSIGVLTQGVRYADYLDLRFPGSPTVAVTGWTARLIARAAPDAASPALLDWDTAAGELVLAIVDGWLRVTFNVTDTATAALTLTEDATLVFELRVFNPSGVAVERVRGTIETEAGLFVEGS